MNRVGLGIVLAACVLGGFGSLQNVRPETPAVQLNELSPDNPSEYYKLGEEVLLGNAEGDDRDLVIDLLVRAVFWGDQRGDTQMASSACIALTQVVGDAGSRWLWDLALLLDSTRGAEWAQATELNSQSRDELVVQASRCVYSIRNHVLPTGEELFGQAAIRGVIFEAGERAGIERTTLVQLLEREISRGDADSCRGRLYIADRGSPGERLVCPDHLRGLGMCANDQELELFLRVEMVLAGVDAETWESSRMIGFDGAVGLPSVGELVRLFRVKPARAFYREGQWVTMP